MMVESQSSLEAALIEAVRQTPQIPPWLRRWIDENDARRLFYEEIRQKKALRRHRATRR